MSVVTASADRSPQLYSSRARSKTGRGWELSESSSEVLRWASLATTGELERTGEGCRYSSCDVVAGELTVLDAEVFWQLPALQFVHEFPLREHKHRMHRALEPLQEQQRGCELTTPLTISEGQYTSKRKRNNNSKL